MSVNTTYDSFSDLMNSGSKSVRKVGTNSNGDFVESQGDTKAFAKADDSMGKDQFLKLLVAQLQHQDPMNPAEDTQFVAQLAQFSQLELAQNSTQAMSQLAQNMQSFMDLQTLQAQSITNASATPLLGKEVRVMETEFDYDGVAGREFNIHLSDGTKSGKVIIRSEDGEIVAEIGVAAERTNGGERDGTIKWDGLDQTTGAKILGGKFTVEVVDKSDNQGGYAYIDGVVSGVNFSASGAALTINGKQYGLGYLVNVEETKTAEVKKDADEDKPTGGYD